MLLIFQPSLIAHAAPNSVVMVLTDSTISLLVVANFAAIPL
jgi:hypothetical protein